MFLTPDEKERNRLTGKPRITSEVVKRAIDRLVAAGTPRKVVVNIGPGSIQSAHVEHREVIEP